MNRVTPTRVIGGRYVVLAELGRGGMGVVWRAEDRVMGRLVAVKELHLPQALSREERALFRERLLREARTAGRLNDPGVVTVYDVVTDDGVDHIVMELVEAPTLAEVVAARGPLDDRSTTTVALQLLSALRTAHESGVVHRDVKPSNVMLGPAGRVRLADFGIAQAADDPRLTMSGAVVGSPAYMSPERLEGAPATPASDMWALGATLFHAVEGRSPFGRETKAATIAAVLHADVPALRTRGPLGAVISGLLQRDQQARLGGQQAIALLSSGGAGSAATGPEDGEPATAPPVTAAPRGRRWWWVVAAALVLGLVLGAVGGYLLGRAGPAVTTFTYGAGGDIPLFDTFTQACLPGQLAPGRSFPSGATVSCDGPHDLEVFETFNPFGISRDLPYPGQAQFADFASGACSLTFGSALIGGPDKDRLAVAALVPSQAAFEARADSSSAFTTRDVICVLHTADGSQLTGTRITKAPG
ncbi:serine/threonine-protein kinase [Pseudonocardia aurantiaca]|uniref:non-specific serine/threonine protein kinase n=1 Tax=Pseudonocardia aurantiaca TaxID=75290 RepID=A0ABW4FFH9_9PSEU